MASVGFIDGMEEFPCDDFNGIPVNYCFEIEFLVACERPGIDYTNFDDDRSDISDNDASNMRWACPPDEDEPVGAILERCKDLLVQNNEPVTVCYEAGYPDLDLGPDRLEYWHLEPCGTARVKKGGPKKWDWFGVRLRSPMYPETELRNDKSNVKWAIGALRMGLTMHVNSTCRFNVSVQPECGPLTLLTAKKLVTLVWVMERDLLLRLSPNSQGIYWRHVKPIDSHSRIASARWKGQVEDSRPVDPLRAGIMDQHLPSDLHNSVIQERLHDVWGAASLRELSQGLCCHDGSPSSLAIRVYDDEEPPVVEFRYALWHPYSTLDASNYWINLAVGLFKATSRESFEFKRYLASIDCIIDGFSKGVSPSARWKILLDKLRLTEDWASPWERILDEYRDGRQLGYPFIDRHNILDQIDELRGYKK